MQGEDTLCHLLQDPEVVAISGWEAVHAADGTTKHWGENARRQAVGEIAADPPALHLLGPSVTLWTCFPARTNKQANSNKKTQNPKLT